MDHYLFVQTGDFGAAWKRFEAGEAETYHEQKRSVDFVREIGHSARVTVVSLSEYQPQNIVISSNVRAISVCASLFFSDYFAKKIISDCKPTAAIVRLPSQHFLSALIEANVPIFPCFADVFTRIMPHKLLSFTGIKGFYRQSILKKMLSHRNVVAVGNHSLSASQSLHDVLGLPKEKIVPWEWSKIKDVGKDRIFPSGRAFRLLYVGAMSEEKGVGDLIKAFQIVSNSCPAQFELHLIGSGVELERYQRESVVLNEGTVVFYGQQPKQFVREKMKEVDAIVIPSRPSYAEGLPNSVVEGLVNCLPLIVTRHASTEKRLTNGINSIISNPVNPESLASNIIMLFRSPSLYESISSQCLRLYDELFIGISWYSAINLFVNDPHNRSGWVEKNSLARCLERNPSSLHRIQSR